MNLYVSFGQQYNLRNSLMKFSNMTEEQVRKYMVEVYKNKYAFIYKEEDALKQIDFFCLSVVYPGEDLYERVN